MTSPDDTSAGAAFALTAIICTHNPRADDLEATLTSLERQEPLPDGRAWELIVIDNASAAPLAGRLDLGWHAQARVVREDILGLTHARLRSFHEARGEILVYIDDDNVLDPDYLRLTLAAFEADPTLGAVGGKSIPRWEADPPAWFDELGISLGCRDLGDEPLIASWIDVPLAQRSYPECAPIGAGMAIRHSAYANYVAAAERDPARTALGRRGSDLASGEDNDMVMSVLEQGLSVTYLPQLRLEHLVGAERLSPAYLARYAHSSNRTWVQVLDLHGIRPWPRIAPWTSPARRLKAYARTSAWMSKVNYIRWRAACGQIDGRALLNTRTGSL